MPLGVSSDEIWKGDVARVPWLLKARLMASSAGAGAVGVEDSVLVLVRARECVMAVVVVVVVRKGCVVNVRLHEAQTNEERSFMFGPLDPERRQVVDGDVCCTG